MCTTTSPISSMCPKTATVGLPEALVSAKLEPIGSALTSANSFA